MTAEDIMDEPIQPFDAFFEGVQPGGLRTGFDIKLLICWLLNTIGQPLEKEAIGQIVTAQKIANYYETMDAVGDLIKNGNIICNTENGHEMLSITENGKMAIMLTQSDLPRTVKEKAAAEALRIITMQRNERENKVDIKTLGNGFEVTFTLESAGSTLIKVTLFAPDSQTASKLKENFLEDPVRLYSQVLSSLMA